MTNSPSCNEYVSLILQLIIIYAPNECFVDTEANVHSCTDDHSITIGNGRTTEVLEVEHVNLNFPLGYVLYFYLVHHVPNVRKNILFGSIFVKESYKSTLNVVKL